MHDAEKCPSCGSGSQGICLKREGGHFAWKPHTWSGPNCKCCSDPFHTAIAENEQIVSIPHEAAR